MLNNQPMTNEMIQKVAPSVFATSPSARQSSKYGFIPTVNVVNAMRAANWEVVTAGESRTRDAQQKGYTKHLLRFAPRSMANLTVVGESRIEVVLVNSHNGSSTYSLSAGVFVLVCGNGLVVSDSLLDSIKIRHSGDVINQVIDGSARILENAPIVNESIALWKELTLAPQEQLALAKSAHALRFPEGSVITPEQMLAPRRRDDNTSSLWNTFNRLQEASIRGGNRAYDPNANDGRGRMVRSRQVKNISGNVNLNKALWVLAEEMAAIKTNAA